MYCKVHKGIIDNCLTFRSILSSINTPTYKLAKFILPNLKSLARNEYTVKGPFAFAEKIVEQDSEFFTGNLDVESLFYVHPNWRDYSSAIIHFQKIRKK